MWQVGFLKVKSIFFQKTLDETNERSLANKIMLYNPLIWTGKGLLNFDDAEMKQVTSSAGPKEKVMPDTYEQIYWFLLDNRKIRTHDGVETADFSVVGFNICCMKILTPKDINEFVVLHLYGTFRENWS